MDIDRLNSILSDLRKCNTSVVMEGYDFNNYSKQLNNMKEEFEERMIDAGFKDVDKFKTSLKDIQFKCEKDNSFSKKSIEISRLDLIKDLIDAHAECGKKVTSFVRSDFNSGEKLLKSLKDAEKSIEKVNEICDEVFSFKDTFDMYFVTNNLIKLIPEFNLKIYFDVLDECIESVLDDEECIEEFSDFRHDNKIEGDSDLENLKDRIAIIHRKLPKVRSVLNSFDSLTFKIYNKIYGLMKHHIDVYSK